MNKIKALYDVVKTMKEKKSNEGVLRIKVEQDDQVIWQFMNEFQRNEDGMTKCKLNTEWNLEGNEGKHESTTELTRKSHDSCPFHKRINHFGPHGRFGHEHSQGRGFKSKADAFLFFLKILNELKVEDQGENLLFSLELDDEVKKMKEKWQLNRMFQGTPHFHHHPFKGKLIKQLMLMEQPQVQIKVIVNKNKEVEKATITVQGPYKKDGSHEMNAAAEVNFTK